MAAFLRRFFAAALIYGTMFAALGALHDYPQLRKQMHKVRMHDAVAERRQWLVLFYLVNEAGSGIKFLFTGNERYMAHYPSPSHILAARTARAEGGNFDMQIEVARMHFFGQFAPRDMDRSMYWLERAEKIAATPAQTQRVAKLLEEVTTARAAADAARAATQ